MAGMKVTLAFTGSIGMTFVILACALNHQWWPVVVVIFYILAPFPTVISRRQHDYDNSPQSNRDFAIFLTMIFVVSSFALPIILARSSKQSEPVIDLNACYLTLAGNTVIYLTYLGFFLSQDELSYRLY